MDKFAAHWIFSLFFANFLNIDTELFNQRKQFPYIEPQKASFFKEK